MSCHVLAVNWERVYKARALVDTRASTYTLAPTCGKGTSLQARTAGQMFSDVAVAISGSVSAAVVMGNNDIH
jgi:hypothetical protein